MPEEIEKLIGKGEQLQLVDGREVKVLFTLFTLAIVERKYGSVDALNDVLQQGTSGPLMDTMGLLLANAIVGEKFTPDEILQQIALEDVHEVFGKITEGMQKGFRRPGQTVATTPENTASDSPGQNSFTPGVPPVSSDNHEVTSGVI